MSELIRSVSPLGYLYASGFAMSCRLLLLPLFSGVTLAFLLQSSLMAEGEDSRAPSPVVVELFTSQGCSSCPPADRLLVGLDEIAIKHQLPVYCLSFHVDYWNSLGWRDPYSAKQFTDRQRRYAAAFDSGRVYTPQMIVNGETEFVGSRARDAQQAIQTGLTAQRIVALKVETQWSADKSDVSVEYDVPEIPPASMLNVALVQNSATNPVPRGENTGRELAHVQVVRQFKSTPLKSSTGKVSLTLPEGLSADDVGVIAYVQDARSMQILGAAKSN